MHELLSFLFISSFYALIVLIKIFICINKVLMFWNRSSVVSTQSIYWPKNKRNKIRIINDLGAVLKISISQQVTVPSDAFNFHQWLFGFAKLHNGVFLNVFTEFSDKIQLKNRIDVCCIWTSYLLCRKPGLYLRTRKAQVMERIIKINPIHASAILQILWIHWIHLKCSSI